MSATDTARQAWRRLYWGGRDLADVVRWRFPRWVLYYGGEGYGDDLLLGTVLYELHRRGERRLAVLSRLGELFEGAPHIDRCLHEQWRALDSVPRFGGRVLRPTYTRPTSDPDIDAPAAQHIIAAMCAETGMRGSVRLRPYFYLRPEERKAGALLPRQAVIQCPGAHGWTRNKDWPAERYQAVVDALRDRFDFVQLGSSREHPLSGVRDLRGRTTLRESAAILANSAFCLTYVGFIMHLARAVECRSVVIYGGREHPDQSGYIANENLYTPEPCAPCWRKNTCPHDRVCLTKIDAAAVIAAVDRLLARPRDLEVAEADVQPWPPVAVPGASTAAHG